MRCASSNTKESDKPKSGKNKDDNELEEPIEDLKKRKQKKKKNITTEGDKPKKTKTKKNKGEDENEDEEKKNEDDNDEENEDNEINSEEESTAAKNKKKKTKKRKGTKTESDLAKKEIKIQEYDNGIVLAENIKQVFQPNLSKDSIISMIKAALNQSQSGKDRTQQRLSPKQISTIGAIIHSTLSGTSLTEEEREKRFTQPIKHPCLKNVLVKVGLRELSPELLKETCYKDKDVTNEEIKRALEGMAQGNKASDIKVLTIEIS